MLSDFQCLLSSDIRELVSKSGEKRFRIQEDLLAAQSDYLRILTKNIPQGGKIAPRELDIGRWDSDTIGRFAEYVYTGNYQCPDPVSLSTLMTTPPPPSCSSSEFSPEIPDLLEKLEAEGMMEELVAPGRPLTPLSEYRPTTGHRRSPRKPPSSTAAAAMPAKKHFDPAKHDFEETFLAHARIYALAVKLEVEPLTALALQRLLRILVDIGPVQAASSVPGNFAELAKYIYSHTYDAQDPLRKIASQFAALNIATLQSAEMKDLIREGGDFASDLAEKISRMISEQDRWGRSKVQGGIVQSILNLVLRRSERRVLDA